MPTHIIMSSHVYIEVKSPELRGRFPSCFHWLPSTSGPETTNAHHGSGHSIERGSWGIAALQEASPSWLPADRRRVLPVAAVRKWR